jgi:hypothetical protein
MLPGALYTYRETHTATEKDTDRERQRDRETEPETEALRHTTNMRLSDYYYAAQQRLDGQ